MPETVIRVENLSKQYVLGKNGSSDGLRHVIHNLATAPFRWLKKPASGTGRETLDARNLEVKGRQQPETFWALKDVSFEIKQGEVMGIIGRNGAGKSTLLKILSRITEPTQGRVEITGRVASLLEVGTGFHPELTGRENIFLNGAILGMSRAEIKKKFDEIVAFSEVEKFLDTPVKRYSSGMYVRLAFAVAAHLEPEILIVDEVLAVGDASFQKKCLGKMQDVSKGGRTVLFVSHNLAAVANLCSRGLILCQGSVELDCHARQAVEHYLQLVETKSGEVEWQNDSNAPTTENIRLRSVRILSAGKKTGEVHIDKPFDVQIEFETLKPSLTVSAGLHLLHPLGGEVLSTVNWPSASLEPVDKFHGKALPLGRYTSTCTIPGFFLNEGEYSLNVVLFAPKNKVDMVEKQVIRFNVVETGAVHADWGDGWIGVVRPRFAWQSERI